MHKSFSQDAKRNLQHIIQQQVQHNKLTITNDSQTINNNVYTYLQPPRQLPLRHYSLQPDMRTGWKPSVGLQKIDNYNHINVFSIRYEDQNVNQIMKQFMKNAHRHRQAIVFLGNRRYNSYALHEKRGYDNPYKRRNYFENRGKRPNINPTFIPKQTYLKFNSNFQEGNLDMVIQRSSNEFDLFIRADTNTRGHTNWYNFQVHNGVFIGEVKFNICNLRRVQSLYQKNLKPYVYSRLCKWNWVQRGENVMYVKQRLRYNLPKNQELKLDKYYKLSFTYRFQKDKDTTKFAYLPPYTYTQLIQLIKNLKNTTLLDPFKTLSGLNIPVLRIAKDNSNIYNNGNGNVNKKVVMITARIHPGQSNSSYVCQGFLQFLCSNDSVAKDLRSRYIFYIVPMMNPDGVIAGNFRTSLFGKDLNRTFDASRKYAFPETYQLLKLARQLKKTYKQHFVLYIDLHGHSTKKNAFMYGPQYSIQNSKYQSSRQLPKILSNLTTLFRYYSCSFRIPESKLSTGRAVFYNQLQIPYTYTLQVSNGCYYNQQLHKEFPFDIKTWKEIGIYLAKSLYQLKLQKSFKIHQTILERYNKNINRIMDKQEQIQMQNQNQSHDDSDADDIQEDLNQKMLKELQESIVNHKQDKQIGVAKVKNKQSKLLTKDEKSRSSIPNKQHFYILQKSKSKELPKPSKQSLQSTLLNKSQNFQINKRPKVFSSFKNKRQKNQLNFPPVNQSVNLQFFIKRNLLYDHMPRNQSQGIKKSQLSKQHKEDSQLMHYIGKNKRKAQQIKQQLNETSVVIEKKAISKYFIKFMNYLP